MLKLRAAARPWLGAAFMLLVAVAAWLVLRYLADPVYRAPGLRGPAQASVAATALPPAIPNTGKHSRQRLAVYLTDPQSPWLSLAFGLRSIGVPFVVTTDAAEAVQHRVVLAYPVISGRFVDTAAADRLRAHVQEGGTLVGFEVLGAGLYDVFGLRSLVAGNGRRSVAWSEAAALRWNLTEPEERTIPFASAQSPFNTQALHPAGAEVLARFDDDQPALLSHAYGAGRSYVLGLDVGAFLGSAQQGRRTVDAGYINAYQPSADVLLRWLKAVYREGEPAAVTLATVPQGRPLSVVLSHDVDYSESMQLALTYAASEARQGVRATYFVQTKYVRDWNDQRFFDAAGMAQMTQLQALGGDLASHSVAHSPVFAQAPMGTGNEQYPDYAPFVESKERTRDVTQLGELRVSKFLLEHAVPQARVSAFRPGHLQYPFGLPQALAATGYRSSSSLSAGTALSHLPFQLSHNRDGQAPVPVYEFPITLEDERVRPMDTALLPRALEIARQLGRYGGMCMVLIHPNVLDDKLRFQERFIEAMQARGAWIGSLSQLAQWWEARDAVEVDVETMGTRRRLILHAPTALNGLALQLPEGWRLADGSPPAMAAVHGLVVDLPAGTTTLTMELAR